MPAAEETDAISARRLTDIECGEWHGRVTVNFLLRLRSIHAVATGIERVLGLPNFDPCHEMSAIVAMGLK
jgi:hypothetical protein